MLEIRYNKDTKVLTAWCADANRFGNLDRGREAEVVKVLDRGLPDKPMQTWLYDTDKKKLIANPDYIEPEPPRDLKTEIDDLTNRVAQLER
jgi:hypothetical protein|tara:strand:- start:65 stop:337 length:273 start_codon:yes stop_codon:yes gene_type:complete